MKTSQKKLMTRYADDVSAYAETRDHRARKQASRAKDTLVRMRAGWEPTHRVDRKRARRSNRVEA